MQIKHAKYGHTNYHLDDQIAVISGNATVQVDDLLPGVQYDFGAVPVSHYGVEGGSKWGGKITATNTDGPEITDYSITPTIGGVIVDTSATAPPSDWKEDVVQLRGTGSLAYGWSEYWGAGITATFSLDLVNVRTGMIVQEIVLTASADMGENVCVLSGVIPAVAGEFIQSTGWFKGSGNARVACCIFPYDGNGNLLGVYRNDWAMSVNWAQRDIGMVVPEGTDHVQVGYGLFADLPGRTGMVYVDDVSITKNSVEVAENPGFEVVNGLTGWEIKSRGKMLNHEITGLASGKTYCSRVMRYNTSGYSRGWSAEKFAVSAQAETPDLAPGSITDKYVVNLTEVYPITTTSTSYVEVTDLTSIIYAPVDSKLLVLFRSNVNNNDGRSIDTRIQIDGVDYYESRFTSSTGNTTGNNNNMALVDVGKGNHTIKIFWQVTAGTGTMRTRQLYGILLKR